MYAMETAPGGVIGRETEFRFHQEGDAVRASYAGGAIRHGYLVGRVSGASLEFRYCQLQTDGVLDGGSSTCELLRDDHGRVNVVEHFQWESREGSGTNVIRELGSDEANV